MSQIQFVTTPVLVIDVWLCPFFFFFSVLAWFACGQAKVVPRIDLHAKGAQDGGEGTGTNLPQTASQVVLDLISFRIVLYVFHHARNVSATLSCLLPDRMS